MMGAVSHSGPLLSQQVLGFARCGTYQRRQFAARLRFGRFIGMVSAGENTYFLRAFEAPSVKQVKPPGDAAAISLAKPPSPKSSSQRTLPWRKTDSNYQSPPETDRQTLTLVDRRPAVHQIKSSFSDGTDSSNPSSYSRESANHRLVNGGADR